MAAIDMSGFDTQTAPIDAIISVLEDYSNGFTNSIETIGIINAIATEWRQ